jgi:hypothetical protein
VTDPYASAADLLIQAGFREVESGCFTSPASPRVAALAVCRPEVATWRGKTEDLLRKEPMRLSPSWARYVILLIDAKKTSALAWAAASFAQDVSKCRRIVLFVDRTTDNPVTLPFVGLPSFGYGSDAPAHDVDAVVRAALPTALAEPFLDEDLATTKLQELVREHQP